MATPVSPEEEVELRPKFKNAKFREMARKVTNMSSFNTPVQTMVDGEMQKVQPVTTAWFLGPKVI